MKTRNRLFWTMLYLAVTLFVTASVQAQEITAQPGANMATMKFTTVPPLPTCATASVPSGDPTKGPSFILAKATAGCTFPWHWHTPNEHLMIISGTASLQMKDAKGVTLRAGAFALMPSHHVHQFKCLSACALYVYSDSAFDMHYVDKQGNEISAADALKPLKEKPATEMK
jgi:quercetin dioxygenase-like cupin family protein